MLSTASGDTTTAVGSSSGGGGSGCVNQLMTCLEIGCGAVFSMKGLKRHLQKECLIARKRCVMLSPSDEIKHLAIV
jgi:hypothetical protein